MFRCSGLRVSFGGVNALEDISATFSSGRVVGIVGPNGAGKTTLLNVLTGFLRPSAGRWFLNGKELTHLTPHMIARCGVSRTFQDIRVVSGLSAKENVMMAASRHPGERLTTVLLSPRSAMDEKAVTTAAEELLQRFGLADASNMEPRILSFGQQKLLALACAVAPRPSMLFLDEPFAGLQQAAADMVCEIVEEQAARGTGVVFVEHDLGMVERIADTVLLMQRGRVIGEDAPERMIAWEGFLDAFIH